MCLVYRTKLRVGPRKVNCIHENGLFQMPGKARKSGSSSVDTDISRHAFTYLLNWLDLAMVSVNRAYASMTDLSAIAWTEIAVQN